MLNDVVRLMISKASPHSRALGFEITSLADGVSTARIPYAEKLAGNPLTGWLHGGVVTSLLDSAAGAAVMSRLKMPMPIATLDLRIDYLRPATPGEDLFARVECYRTTKDVAFFRGVAHNGDLDDAVASASGTFMLNTTAIRLPGSGKP